MLNSPRYAYLRYITNIIATAEDGTTSVATETEDISDSIILYLNKFDTDIDIGSAQFLGLAQTDLVNWYMKPTTLSLGGISVVSRNPFITSDNIVTKINDKLKQNLSENNFNYYSKPRFLLYIQNDLNSLNTYEGVITHFGFTRSAEVPDAYNWSLSFNGKPYIEQVKQQAAQTVAKINRQTPVETQINAVNKAKFIPNKFRG